jgi:hypothetical protein
MDGSEDLGFPSRSIFLLEPFLANLYGKLEGKGAHYCDPCGEQGKKLGANVKG